jgi:hypothetical protein
MSSGQSPSLFLCKLKSTALLDLFMFFTVDLRIQSVLGVCSFS